MKNPTPLVAACRQIDDLTLDYALPELMTGLLPESTVIFNVITSVAFGAFTCDFRADHCEFTKDIFNQNAKIFFLLQFNLTYMRIATDGEKYTLLYPFNASRYDACFRVYNGTLHDYHINISKSQVHEVINKYIGNV